MKSPREILDNNKFNGILMSLLFKRCFDIFVSLTLTILLMPLLAFVAVLVFLNIGSPIFFTQFRPGKNGKLFKMVKFRTMINIYDENGNLLDDSERLTKFGRILRATSLDELPGLYNVLKGDMSLVGPRPLLEEYLPLYNEHQAMRHNIRPGITGWAQVNGRNALSWEEKFAYDVWYVKNRNMLIDLKILLLTVKKVLVKEGITDKKSETMSKFNGNEKSESSK